MEIEMEPLEVRRRLDGAEALRMLDVREPFEHEIASIDGADLVPMRNVPGALEALRAGTGTLVVFCHHGVRSLQVVEWLRAQGLEDCTSMAGGIERWSLEVDRGVARY